jgi:hypothetical protein
MCLKDARIVYGIQKRFWADTFYVTYVSLCFYVSQISPIVYGIQKRFWADVFYATYVSL